MRRRSRQSGYVLLVILFLLFLLVLGLTAIAQRVKTQIQRDREEEMIHRGKEYQRAVGRFYRKFGRYPLSIEQLEDTNHVRFLRKRYKDPTAPDGQWKVLHMGEAKNAPVGLFGQKLTVGTGLGGSSLGTSTVGGQSPNQSPYGSLQVAPNTSGNAIGSGGQNPSNSDNKSDNTNAGAGGSGGQQLPGTSPDQLGKGQTFGGGPIIGVVSLSRKEALKEYQGKSHYNEWEFVYDPIADRALQIQKGASPQGVPGAVIPGQFNNPANPQNPTGDQPKTP